MKVLALNLEKTWRGGERQTLFNAIGLRNQGVNVEILCRKDSELSFNAKDNGFEILEFSRGFSVIWFLIFNAKKYDILHAQSSKVLTYCVLAKLFSNVKVVFSRRVAFKPSGFFTKLKYQSANAIVGISEPIIEIVQTFTGKNVELISDAVDYKKLDIERARDYVNQIPDLKNKKIILSVAALTSEKDPFILAKAILALRVKRNDFCVIHFGDGNLRNELEVFLNENNLQDCYYLAGYINQVEDFYSVASVFSISSKDEGLGSSVLDAFLYKVPCATTNAGGLKYLLANEKGLLCDVGDSDALSLNIDLLLDAKSTHIVDNAFEYVIKNHSIDKIGLAYKQLFERLIAND